MPKLRNTKQSHSNYLAEEKTSTNTYKYIQYRCTKKPNKERTERHSVQKK